MKPTSPIALSLVFFCLGTMATSAAAQDLFELEVFPYETTPAGDYEVAMHANAVSRDRTLPSVAANHKPVHLSVEIVRGWNDRLETGVFIQTAPFGAAQSTRFAGGHIRSKLRLGDISSLGLRFAVGAEYTLNRPVFDRELQTLEVRSIVDYRRGRLSLIANPTLEMVTRGSDTGLDPSFDLSARAGWKVTPLLTAAAEYFSRPSTTRHLEPEETAHYLLFGNVEFEIAARWELGLGAGHCVTRHEPWLIKSVIGYRF
jgi:hypothetical protein